MVAALTFFLGKDEESKEKDDSDSDQEVMVLSINPVSPQI